MPRNRECYLLIREIRVAWRREVLAETRDLAPSLRAGCLCCVRSGVMGSSDGFESKKVGVPAPGTSSGRMAPGEAAGARRDAGPSPFSGHKETATDHDEVTGVIKWFVASMGYGFIVPDNGWPDVLLHVTVLRRDGYQTAYEGARLVVECVQRHKGYQAFRIVSMDESTAIHPAQLLPPRTHVSVTPTSGLERAQVKWFNRLRGFGFVTSGEGTPNIFVHMETLRRFGMTELRPNQKELVRYGPGSKGMMAAEIHPEAGSPALSSH